MENQVLSIPQMEELKALDIDTSSASMFWEIYEDGKKALFTSDLDSFSKSCPHILTFTLQDILELLPKTIAAYKNGSELPLMITITGSGKYAIVYYNPFYKNGKVGLTKSESLLEAAFKMLKWVKQNNYI